jgi:hypothetical protein
MKPDEDHYEDYDCYEDGDEPWSTNLAVGVFWGILVIAVVIAAWLWWK